MNEEIGTVDAAKILEVSKRHVLWYHVNGYLPGRKLSERVYLFRRRDVEKLRDNKPKRTGRPKKGDQKAVKKPKPKRPKK